MARIPNFPQRLLDEHFRWHSNMDMNVPPGVGIDFLRFHRNFLRKSLKWYKEQKLNPDSVAPWSSIPSEIKMHPSWNGRLEAAEIRITRNLSSFPSSDELGRYLLTSSLHDAVHAFGGDVYNEMDFSEISLSPRSTLFYQWHRLIDRWWRDFQRMQKQPN